MSEVSSHNNADFQKEEAQKSKQSRVVSTHNVIPYNREVQQKDVKKFIDRRKTTIEKNTNEIILPDIAKMPEDDFGIEPVEEKEAQADSKIASDQPAEHKKPGRKKKDAD